MALILKITEAAWSCIHYMQFNKVTLLPLKLTHWGRDEMAAVSQATFSNVFLWMKILYFDSNFIKFVSKGPIDNNSALVHVMSWRGTGGKPLSESLMIILLTYHSASVS